MRKPIVSNFITLDGYYEDRHKSLNSLFDYHHVMAGEGTPLFEGRPPVSLKLIHTRQGSARRTSWPVIGLGGR